MKMKSLFSALAIFFYISLVINAQEQTAEEKNPLKSGTIKEQIEHTINKSSKWEDYRVIKSVQLSILKSNILDTISILKTNIKNNDIATFNQTQKVDSLTNLISISNSNLETAISDKNSLTFLGISMQKSSYQKVTFSIIVILILGIGGVFFLFKRSNMITTETKETLKELQEEFDAHRKRSLEREKTMARNHLNEINKLRNK